ncbi:ABC transporter ATP-binding protein [Agromyces aerolatus]|uniref:ABC transporter ATP-binding protein n=1 Tax=Agromyces sp. LY-1074 TaxID=3074080 RepID=UPI00285A73FC|nr:MULTISPECIES: ABC transporter ATP-binding protein [unclassified Agromyces]MDR5700833.1 ABC transporter ATP-binding protein [Agromyces sp. LY-1074]MDR5707354.1 ABC transporter ATP-binding protein [Agromyces sp. LY-1358]
MSGFVQIRGLRLALPYRGVLRPTLDGVDLDIDHGEVVGLMGPSGSGKTSLAHVLTGYLPRRAVVRADRLVVGGRDLQRIEARGLRAHRRENVGIVYQDPASALTPTAKIGAQIAEVHALHGLDRGNARSAAIASIDDVGLSGAELAHRYPHELSGGERQRVMIAMALAGHPPLLILDEPTTGLDPVSRAEILDLIAALRRERDFAMLVITHDSGLAAARCSRVVTMEAGRIMHRPPALVRPPTRSGAGVRTARASAIAAPRDSEIVLAATGIRVRRGTRTVVDDVHVELRRGETLGLVGRTGSGKTSLALALAGLIPHDGDVRVAAPRARGAVQLVFQSPEASLNPRRNVRKTLKRAIELLGGDATPDLLAERAGFDLDLLDRVPSALSGGQQQRVAIARAFAGTAPVVVCDEPTSALDAELGGRILDLVIALQEQTGVACLFISHDLLAVRRISHRVAVMEHGRIIEMDPTDTAFDSPTRAGTRELIAAGVWSHESE